MSSLSHTTKSRNLHLEFSVENERQAIKMGFGRHSFASPSLNYLLLKFIYIQYAAYIFNSGVVLKRILCNLTIYTYLLQLEQHFIDCFFLYRNFQTSVIVIGCGWKG